MRTKIETQELIKFIDESLIDKLNSILNDDRLTTFGKVEDSTIACDMVELIKESLK
jgi:hypothetical protein